jgi:hypothetical protein
VKSPRHEDLDREDEKMEEKFHHEFWDPIFEKPSIEGINFPLIEYEDYKRVKKVWDSKEPIENIVVRHEHIPEPLSVKNLKTTKGTTWINDEV